MVHATHVAPLGPVYPAKHWQAVALLLPGGDVECAGQAVHVLKYTAPASVPAVEEYLPASQDAHATGPCGVESPQHAEPL